MTVLHQVVPMLHDGDAVGNHCSAIQQLLRDHGVESEIFVGLPDPATVHRTHPIEELPDRPALYHVAVVSHVADVLLARSAPFGIDHHNITPPAWFRPWREDHLVAATDAGRRQLALLAPRADFALADSAFNAQDVESLAGPPTAVAPVIFDPAVAEPDAATADRLTAQVPHGSAAWLFVGRIVPNKAQHDVVLAFAAYRRLVDPGAVLRLVGGISAPRYAEALRRLVNDLGLADAVEITGAVSPAVLAAHYSAADVFVCLSEHEGFCVPVIEAMRHGLPVVAYDAGAVGETIGNAGVLLEEKSPVAAAMAVATAVAPATGGVLRDLGKARALEFAPEVTSSRMWNGLRVWLSAI